MISLSLIISIITAFLVSLFLTPKLARYLKDIGLTGIDVQKPDKPEIPEMGGPAVIAGFLSGIFLFIWIKVFLYGKTTGLVEIFAGITTVLIIFLVGMLDDISGIKKIKGKRKGLKQWQKPLLTLPASIPLIAIMAGNSSISLPFIGSIDIGILYPLALVPIGVVGASNAINMLAGLNGLEAGLGVVLTSALGIFALINENLFIGAFALTFAGALLGFLIYNWYPARIFPGDSLCYAIGAVVACVAILGNMEKFALLCFIPWFLELILKARSKFKAQSFGKLRSDGTLEAPYEKCYSLTHCVMKLGKFKEKEVVIILILFEILITLLAFKLVNVI